jgi:hypothetical protein
MLNGPWLVGARTSGQRRSLPETEHRPGALREAEAMFLNFEPLGSSWF